MPKIPVNPTEGEHHEEDHRGDCSCCTGSSDNRVGPVGEGVQREQHAPRAVDDEWIAAALDVVARARLFQEWADAQGVGR